MGVDDATDAVARLDLTTGEPEILATVHSLLYGLAIDSKDRIFVSGASTTARSLEVLKDGNIRMVSPGGMTLQRRRSDRTARTVSHFSWPIGAPGRSMTRPLENYAAARGTWWPGTLTNPTPLLHLGTTCYWHLARTSRSRFGIPCSSRKFC